MAQQSIVGEKVGMTQTWVDDKVVPVTVLRVEPMRIVQIKTNERDGYTALQVTYGHRKANKLTKPALGHFEKAGVDPGPRLVELRLDDVSDYSVGQELKADLFIALLRADSTARLDTLLDEIGEIDGVSKTTTSVVLALRVDRMA